MVDVLSLGLKSKKVVAEAMVAKCLCGVGVDVGLSSM